jgi:hypothetical protein
MSDSPGRLPHFVDNTPYDPAATETMSDAQRRFYSASPWRLMRNSSRPTTCTPDTPTISSRRRSRCTCSTTAVSSGPSSTR